MMWSQSWAQPSTALDLLTSASSIPTTIKHVTSLRPPQAQATQKGLGELDIIGAAKEHQGDARQ